jgi:tetratricopeptide (TPR) repeat protein
MLERSGSVQHAEAQEVTHDQHLNHVTEGDSRSPSKSGVARRISNMMTKTPRQKRSPVLPSRAQRDSLSVCSDNATAQSAEGQQSVISVQSATNYTVTSQDTVLISNRAVMGEEQGEEFSEGEPKKSKRWSKIKKMIGVKTAPIPITEESPSAEKLFAKDDNWKSNSTPDSRRRINSADSREPRRVRSTPVPSSKDQEMMDQSIVGRMDGVDVISLGLPALGSQTQQPGGSEDSPRLPWDSSPTHMFSGRPVLQTPAQMVADMLWTSGGRSQPEMILEGFLPGCEDRWSVRFEHLPNKDSGNRSLDDDPDPPSSKGLGTDEYETLEDGSPNMPSHQIWNMLWGSNPAPSNLTDLERVSETDDPLLNLAAENSIPIDIDEDTFIVSNSDHLYSIHEITTVPLSKGQFDAALIIFYKLLKGLELLNEAELRFLRGSVRHNIGVIQLWQANYEYALASFEKAVEERLAYLPSNHADIVVSLVQKGTTYFALERFEEAIATWNIALPMTQLDHIIRAKILNNLGVAQYHQKDFSAALKNFTASLEIQRHWLEIPIRRETNVYDAAVLLGNMGKLYLEKPDYDLAYFVYEEALLLQTTVFRKDHDIVLAGLTSLALAKAQNKQLKKALQILTGCLRSQNVRFGTNSVASIDTTGLMGYLYAREENYDEALKCLVKVKKWQSARLPASHSALEATNEAIKKLEESIEWV